MSNLETNSAAESIERLTRQNAQPFTVNGVPMLVLPGNCVLKPLPELLDAPQRIAQTVTLHTATALIDYWNRYATAASTLFFDLTAEKFTAVLDYHDAIPGDDLQLPSWCSHVAAYQPPKTAEWKTWEGKSGHKFDQVEFAYFVEQNVADIATPTGAEMLEIVTTLKAKTRVDFNKAVKLASGHNELTYNEMIDGKAGATGQLKIPEDITLGIKPFQGSDGYMVPAKFRYRITEGGKLTMWYDLLRPHKVNETALADIVTRVRDGIKASRSQHFIEGRV